MSPENTAPDYLVSKVDGEVFEKSGYREISFTAQDGLKLYARDYGAQHGSRLAVICLHGFSRNCKDFHATALRLSKKRRVIVPDMRGRGRSDYAADWRDYSVLNEALDVLDMMVVLGVTRAVIFGTSRGGLIAMAIGSMRPGVLKGVILNDIGPAIETAGLMRISGQLTNAPQPADWDHAAMLVEQGHRQAMPDLGKKDWMAFAKTRYKETDDGLKADYDPELARVFAKDIERTHEAQFTLWPRFTAIYPFPTLVLHGALSELLSAQTVKEMVKRHPDLTALTIPNRGHVPMLNEPGIAKAIDQLIAKAEKG